MNHELIHDFSIYFSFVEWTHEVMSSDTGDALHLFQLLGAVEALAAIFKVCFDLFNMHHQMQTFLSIIYVSISKK